MVFIFLLFITIISRQIIAYTSPVAKIRAPESTFDIVNTGGDFEYGVYNPASKLFVGVMIKNNVAIYGPGMTFIVSLLQSINPMTPFVYYQISLVIIILFYLLIYLMILNKVPEKIKIVSILFGITFFLGVPFSLGFHQGNIDNLLAGMLGIIIIVALQKTNGRIKKINLMWSLFVTSSLGFMVSTKIYLLIFVIPFILFYPKKMANLSILFLVYIIFTLSPYFYGIRTDILDPILSAQAYMADYENLFWRTFYLSKNNSTMAMATFFTSCVAQKSCMTIPGVRKVLTIISTFMLSFVFIGPIMTEYKKLFYLLNILRKRLKSYRLPLILLFLTMGSAAINLIPLASPSYRLCYSFVITLIVYVFAENKENIKIFVLYSMVFLCIYGLWVPSVVQSSGLRLFDIRAWNMLLLFHYYFLIKAMVNMSINYKR